MIQGGRGDYEDMRPRSARLVYTSSAMMRWSWTGMPISWPASTSCWVILMSSFEGSTFPDGWLCAAMIAPVGEDGHLENLARLDDVALGIMAGCVPSLHPIYRGMS